MNSAPSLSAQLQAKLDAVIQFPAGASGMGVRSSGVSDKVTHSKQQMEADNQSSTYRNFSRVIAEKDGQPSAMIAQSTTAKEPTFPVKLHMILSNPEYSDIISWLPHGRSWRILQQKAFEEQVIPLYFRHGRYSSFARQVNGWGFRRITHGSDYNSYYHEMFLRGMPHLTEKMRRLTTKDISKRRKLDEEPVPDFYLISREHPLPSSAGAARSGSIAPVESSNGPSRVSSAAVAAAANAAPINCTPRAQAMMPSMTGAGLENAELELALLERRRANILDRMNALSGSGISSKLLSAAPTSSLGLTDPALASYMNLQSSNSLFHPTSEALQRQLLGARIAQNDMAKYLGLGVNNSYGLPASLMGHHARLNPYGL